MIKNIVTTLLFLLLSSPCFAGQVQIGANEPWGTTRGKINSNASNTELRLQSAESRATALETNSLTSANFTSKMTSVGVPQKTSSGYVRLYEDSAWGVNYADIIVDDSLATNHVVKVTDDGVTFDGLKTKVIVSSGQITLPSATITAGSCASVVQILAPDVETTDFIDYSFASDPTSLTGYGAPPFVRVLKYGTTGKINFKVCNDTASSITTSAVAINWEITR